MEELDKNVRDGCVDSHEFTKALPRPRAVCYGDFAEICLNLPLVTEFLPKYF
jgi:hypothetical protein